MKKNHTLALAALSAMSFLSLAQAEDTPPDDRWYIAPFGTFIKAGGDRGSDDGWGGGMGIGKMIDEHFNVEARGFWQGFGGNGGDWNLTGGTADVQYFLFRDDFSPYAVLGFRVALASIILAACASSDAPAQAVESYLNALVNKEADKLPTLVCGEWEEDALIELDSFQAVTARLENVACSQTGTDGDTTLVLCTGNIVATYDNEDQQLALSARTYQVIEQGGDWLVCGTR